MSNTHPEYSGGVVKDETLLGIPQTECKSTLTFGGVKFVCNVDVNTANLGHLVHQEAGETEDGGFYRIMWEDQHGEMLRRKDDGS